MADNNKKTSRITNTDTLARRAWIDAALQSVRLHLNASAFVPPVIDAVGHEAALEQPQLQPQPPESREDRRKHGQLYIAWSEGERRSGT